MRNTNTIFAATHDFPNEVEVLTRRHGFKKYNLFRINFQYLFQIHSQKFRRAR